MAGEIVVGGAVLLWWLLRGKKTDGTPIPNPTPSGRTYVVQPGDSLTLIAIKLGLCTQPTSNTMTAWAPCLRVAEAFKAINPQIKHIDRIEVGWVLKVPEVG